MIEPADIRRLLDAFEKSDWNEIRLSVDGTDVLISASDNPVELAAARQKADSGAPTETSAAPAPAASTSEVISAPSVVAKSIPDGERIVSTSPGIFWRSPAPGAPPFIEVGQKVEPDTVVCIVEVMKLMNRVTAGISGTVAAVLVENSEKISRNEVLFVVTPD